MSEEIKTEPAGATAEPAGAEKLVLTKDEFDAKLQSEADKRVTGALKTAQEKWEAEWTEKLKTEKAEAERLALMSADEKQKALSEKKEAEIKDRESKLILKEVHLKAINKLADEKLPVGFAEFILEADETKTFANIALLKKQWTEALDEAVKAKLQGRVPHSGDHGERNKVSMNDLIRRRTRR